MHVKDGLTGEVSQHLFKHGIEETCKV